MMRDLFRMIRKWKFNYAPLVEISISKQNLLHNLAVFQGINKDVRVAPVLKSNAYGHGLVLTAQIFDKQNLPFFVVDSYYEALILRNEGIKTPVLIIGFTREENIISNRLKNIIFTLTSLEQIERLSKILKRPAEFHIKVDTGMGRQGISERELEISVKFIKSNSFINLTGVASHLADADSLNQVYTKDQITRWNNTVEKIKTAFPSLKYFHLSSSAGYFYSSEIKANVMRLGIGLYGIQPNVKRDKDLDLRPVLQMKSIVSGIKSYERGEKIGYSGTFEVKDKMRIATLPLGYNEGVDRRLSNVGFIKIGGEFCPIVGRVSMNITSLDVTKVPDAALGNSAIIISRDTEDRNSIENIAKICETIPYEILVHLPGQIRRKVE